MNTETVGILTIIVGFLTVVAIVAGPIVALQLQRSLDNRRAARDRKLYIFKTLMTYRVTTVAPAFVQALNLIDIEFAGNNAKEKAVREAWKVLLDHFIDLREPNTKEKPVALTVDKSATLTTNLLKAMGTCLGYDFDEVHLKKGAYYPQFLVNVENEQHQLRRETLELLAGQRKLPIAVFEDKFPDLLPISKANAAVAREKK